MQNRTGFVLLLMVAWCTLPSWPTSPVTAQESAQESTEAADPALVEMVIGFLKEDDKELRGLAYEQVRAGAPGAAATQQFAAELPKLSAESQIGLIRALAERGDGAARDSLLQLLDAEQSDVRVAVLEALAFLGNADDVDLLWKKATSDQAAEAAAARSTLERMPIEEVNNRLVTRLSDLSVSQQATLIEILAARRASSTVPALLQAAVADKPAVRSAAMNALGQLAGAEHIAAMVQGVLKAERGPEQVAAEKAVMFVCQRIEDPAHRAEPLAAAIRDLPAGDRLAMLTTLARVGGAEARADVDAAINSKNADEHAAGLRAIANWPDATIAPRLLEIIKTDPHPSHKTLVLRALIRVAVLPDERTNAARLELLRQAMTLATRDAERLFVLQRAQAVRDVETLRYVMPYVKLAAFREAACTTIVELAHHRQLRDAHKNEFLPALDLVIKNSSDATTVDRARRYKNNQTWVRPK
ncbi:MAG: HEAT repeat domain-containing protein [Planctomycetales bacterium]|nr:HEAT repeat domain-containing protein [Planctomycetales bacterium]